jgi:hypothetical protein
MRGHGIELLTFLVRRMAVASPWLGWLAGADRSRRAPPELLRKRELNLFVHQ